jgi:hypothetical protein
VVNGQCTFSDTSLGGCTYLSIVPVMNPVRTDVVFQMIQLRPFNLQLLFIRKCVPGTESLDPGGFVFNCANSGATFIQLGLGQPCCPPAPDPWSVTPTESGFSSTTTFDFFGISWTNRSEQNIHPVQFSSQLGCFSFPSCQ